MLKRCPFSLCFSLSCTTSETAGKNSSLFNAVNTTKAEEAFGRIENLDLIERVLSEEERDGHSSFHG